MRRMGIPEHIIVLIKNLHSQQEATVRTEFGNTEWFPIRKGVRQGCILSPGLFNIYYNENIMRNANLDLYEQGIIIGGRKVNNLRYADDTTLIARSKEDLHQLIKHVKESSACEGLLLNIKKTKILTTAPGLNEFTLGTEKVEVVDCFTFLGSTIDRKGGCFDDIRKRLALGRAAMTKLMKIIKDRDVKTTAKTRIVRTMVFPVATYGSESWTLSKKDVRQIDAFELWVWKRLLRTPWTERKTNEWVLQQINEDNTITRSLVISLGKADFATLATSGST